MANVPAETDRKTDQKKEDEDDHSEFLYEAMSVQTARLTLMTRRSGGGMGLPGLQGYSPEAGRVIITR